MHGERALCSSVKKQQEEEVKEFTPEELEETELCASVDVTDPDVTASISGVNIHLPPLAAPACSPFIKFPIRVCCRAQRIREIYGC